MQYYFTKAPGASCRDKSCSIHTTAVNFIACLGLLIMHSCAQEGFAHCLFMDEPDVKGHVKSVTDSTKYLLVDSLYNTSDWVNNTTDFDEQGKWHGGSESANGFEDENDIDYMFGITGRFSRDQLRGKDTLYKPQRTDYKHKAKYNLEEDYMTMKDGTTFLRYQYHYNDDCILLEFKKYSNDSKLETKCTFRYDEHNNLVECFIYRNNDALIKKIKYTYDKAYIIKAYTVYNVTAKLTTNYTFTYAGFDANGNWQKRSKQRNNRLIAVTMRKVKYF